RLRRSWSSKRERPTLTAATVFLPTVRTSRSAVQPRNRRWADRPLLYSSADSLIAATTDPPSLSVFPMSEGTRILSALEHGDGGAADQLLPLVYDELRKLAAQKVARESPGQTLQATGLVHEAYLRLVDVEQAQHWNSRGHFFAAAAEAMRRLLVESARRKGRSKRGGELRRHDIQLHEPAAEDRPAALLPVDQAPAQLAPVH